MFRRKVEQFDVAEIDLICFPHINHRLFLVHGMGDKR
jgi:hypothetical protein